MLHSEIPTILESVCGVCVGGGGNGEIDIGELRRANVNLRIPDVE